MQRGGMRCSCTLVCAVHASRFAIASGIRISVRCASDGAIVTNETGSHGDGELIRIDAAPAEYLASLRTAFHMEAMHDPIMFALSLTGDEANILVRALHEWPGAAALRERILMVWGRAERDT